MARDPVDDPRQLLARGPRVARVEARSPGPNSPTASQSRPSRVEGARHRILSACGVLDEDRETEAAVGSTLERLAPVLDPLAGVVLGRRTWPPCTIRPLAPIAAAAAACCARILRLGIRILLFVLATFTRYGAWM